MSRIARQASQRGARGACLDDNVFDVGRFKHDIIRVTGTSLGSVGLMVTTGEQGDEWRVHRRHIN